jgi:hypothetical protein
LLFVFDPTRFRERRDMGSDANPNGRLRTRKLNPFVQDTPKKIFARKRQGFRLKIKKQGRPEAVPA